MTYEEAAAYIEEVPKFTKKNKLSHTKECLRRLGDPQKRFRVIHVAGTNGKGSTCAFLASVLREAGYSCGLFTSPHLVAVNERFQIDGRDIDNETFLAAFERVKALSEELLAEGSYHPTYFEMLFLMGMLIFADAGVDYVVLETGLGGRLDATTAVEDPIACVITSISRDHMQFLGDTVEAIAAEKAGIIVPGVPVICDGNDERAVSVIRNKALDEKSPCFEVSRQDTQIRQITRAGIDFSLRSGYYGSTVFSIPFIARYQVMNGALALKTLEVLKEEIPVSLAAVKKGLSETRWQGRMETVRPGVIVDGAHNEDGVEKFVETAEHFQKEYPLTLLFSAVEDKDYVDMIRTILKRVRFRHVVTTQVGGYRQVPAQQLKEVFTDLGCTSAQAVPDVRDAYRKAASLKGEDGLLFCVGSLYLVGEIKALLMKESEKEKPEENKPEKK